MRAGALRDRVKLQQLVETPDALGQPVQSWTDLGTYWANVRELAGRRAVTARQLNAEVTHAVTLRNLPTFVKAATHRLVMVGGATDGRILGIDSVIDADGLGRRYELTCKAIVR
jgi:SPP1 family predicted phage head-tail adaptor